jgi:phenylalanyl-tRNA synthetase alpha chain
MSELREIVESAGADVAQADSLAALDAVRVKYLGKKGALTEQLKKLGKLPPADRPEAGRLINLAKAEVAGAVEQRKAALEDARLELELSSTQIDVTLPGRGGALGGAHPITQTMTRIEALLFRYGFVL